VERKLKALVACFGFFLCSATYPVSAESLPAPLVQFNGYATTEKIGGDFELLGFDSAGEHKVSLRQFRGKYLLLLFGFTHCPISCPTILARAAQIVDSMDHRNDLAVIFVTLDPARDRPNNLEQFLKAFNADFIGLSGSEEQIRKVADAYRVSYSKQVSGTSYTIDHSTYMYLLDKAGRVVFLYPENESALNIAQDVKNLMRMESPELR
jgi:protein SCO1/2